MSLYTHLPKFVPDPQDEFHVFGSSPYSLVCSLEIMSAFQFSSFSSGLNFKGSANRNSAPIYLNPLLVLGSSKRALKARKYVARAFDCHVAESHTSVRCNVYSSNGARLRFDSSTFERLVPSVGVFLANSNTRNSPRHVRIEAFNPQGGGSGGGRVVVNLAIAGVLTYLTVTGRLNWLFEAILYIWIFVLVLFWVLERNLIKGRCPNCGGEFQVFELSVKDGPRLCPYCSQPFKMENKQFVREGPQFSNERRRDSKWPFGGFGQQPASTQEQKPSEAVVDIEAEVIDKD